VNAAAEAPRSAFAEHKGHPVTVTRMTGLETAAAILGGTDMLAAALGITPRGVRHKLTGDRGVSTADLIAAADALEARARRMADHAFKLREEARPKVDHLTHEMATAPVVF